jgi:hypothetical protein
VYYNSDFIFSHGKKIQFCKFLFEDNLEKHAFSVEKNNLQPKLTTLAKKFKNGEGEGEGGEPHWCRVSR